MITENCDNNADQHTHRSRSVFAIDVNNHIYIQLVSPNQPLKNLNDVEHLTGDSPGPRKVHDGLYQRTRTPLTRNKFEYIFSMDYTELDSSMPI